MHAYDMKYVYYLYTYRLQKCTHQENIFILKSVYLNRIILKKHKQNVNNG